MRPRISMTGHVRRSVGPSVRPSVRPSVGDDFAKKTRKINVFEQIIARGGILDESDVITSSYN